MRLYRAASMAAPYFGQGSYWTPSRRFADYFRGWLDEHAAGAAPHAVYAADVELTSLLEVPFGIWVDSPRITELVPEFASRGYHWVRFHEGVHDGEVHPQFVYLANAPIVAALLAPKREQQMVTAAHGRDSGGTGQGVTT
jgi:hypothetical protein